LIKIKNGKKKKKKKRGWGRGGLRFVKIELQGKVTQWKNRSGVKIAQHFEKRNGPTNVHGTARRKERHVARKGQIGKGVGN